VKEQLHAAAALLSARNPEHPLNSRLSLPRSWSGGSAKEKTPCSASKQPRICSQRRSHCTYLKINYGIKTFSSKRPIILGAVFPHSLTSLNVHTHVSLPFNSDSLLNYYPYKLTGTIGTLQVMNYQWPLCMYVCKQVKQSRYRPGVAQMVSGS
jgi:hypothetical protein